MGGFSCDLSLLLKPKFSPHADLCGTASGSVHVLEWNSEEPVVSMLTNTFALTSQGLNTPLSTGVRGNPVSVLHIDSSGKRVSLVSVLSLVNIPLSLILNLLYR